MLSTILVQPVSSYLRERGISISKVAKECGFDARLLLDPEEQISFELIAQFFEHCGAVSGEPLFGLDCGLNANIEQRSVLHYLCTASSTLREALVSRSRYSRLLSTAHQIVQHERDQSSVWEWKLPLSPVRRVQLTDYLIALHVRRIKGLLRRNISPVVVAFDHATLADFDEYSNRLNCECKFDNKTPFVRYHLDILDENLPTANTGLKKALEPILESATKSLPNRLNVVNKTKANLVAHLGGGEQHISLVAKSMGMSTRTLQRQLHNQGVTFRTVLEEAKQELAVELLSRTDLNISQIALALGYSDLSAFSRQFKSWFDRSPRQYRVEVRR